MHPMIATALTVLTTVLASGGFWTLLQHRLSRNDAQTKLLLGLARDRIIANGMMYLNRGWITKDELDDYYSYFYRWYHEFGGNGLADRIYHDVLDLPVYEYPPVPISRKEHM